MFLSTCYKGRTLDATWCCCLVPGDSSELLSSNKLPTAANNNSTREWDWNQISESPESKTLRQKMLQHSLPLCTAPVTCEHRCNPSLSTALMKDGAEFPTNVQCVHTWLHWGSCFQTGIGFICTICMYTAFPPRCWMERAEPGAVWLQWGAMNSSNSNNYWTSCRPMKFYILQNMV